MSCFHCSEAAVEGCVEGGVAALGVGNVGFCSFLGEERH